MPAPNTLHIQRVSVRRRIALGCASVVFASVSIATTTLGIPAASASNPTTGTLYSWGAGAQGDLGDGTTVEHNSPEVITLAPGVTPTAISGGAFYTLAIGSDGNLYAWGNNGFGNLGDGSTNNHLSPEVVTLAPGVTPTAISAGDFESFAIGSDGKLYGWGANEYGALGDGTIVQHDSPEVITLAPGVTPTAISAGGYGGTDESMAIGSDGNLYAWGYNGAGDLGDGTTVEHNSPEVITLAPGVTPKAISAGNGFGLAIGSSGQLYAWGLNQYGTLGDGTTVEHNSPEVITLASGVTPTAISAAASHSLAIGSDGNLYAWGLNAAGELGDGTTVEHNSPEVISLAAGIAPTAIAAGGDQNLAIGSDGNLYVWGINQYGQLGDGTTVEHDSPEVITLAPGVTASVVSAGLQHSLAIGSAGLPANTPETPFAIVLPIIGVVAFGGVWIRRRRLRSTRI